jgi:hypothetical protein
MKQITIGRHQFDARWIGKSRNGGTRTRLYDLFVVGRRLSDAPPERSEVPALIAAYMALLQREGRVEARRLRTLRSVPVSPRTAVRRPAGYRPAIG